MSTRLATGAQITHSPGGSGRVSGDASTAVRGFSKADPHPSECGHRPIHRGPDGGRVDSPFVPASPSGTARVTFCPRTGSCPRTRTQFPGSAGPRLTVSCLGCVTVRAPGLNKSPSTHTHTPACTCTHAHTTLPFCKCTPPPTALTTMGSGHGGLTRCGCLTLHPNTRHWCSWKPVVTVRRTAFRLCCKSTIFSLSLSFFLKVGVTPLRSRPKLRSGVGRSTH